MLKQTLFFTTPVRLSLKNCQLVVSWRDSNDMVTRPIEDIGFVIIENQQVSVTIPLLNELVRNKASVVFCDEKCMPCSMLWGFENNSTQSESIKSQVEATVPAKKRAWQQLVKSKILNQAAVLELYGRDASSLKALASAVASGDTTNREGIAAKLYWKGLLGADFRRLREGPPPNNLLNYGYSILRAAVTRALLGSGLFPQFGLFHKSRYDAFPLADDVMEPYRAFVDRIVMEIYDAGEALLNKDTKAALLRVLFADVKIGEVTRPLQVALTMTAASLVKYFRGEIKNLALPIFV